MCVGLQGETLRCQHAILMSWGGTQRLGVWAPTTRTMSSYARGTNWGYLKLVCAACPLSPVATRTPLLPLLNKSQQSQFVSEGE